MLSTLKAVINNKRKYNYLKNRDRVNLKRISDTKEDTNNVVYDKGSRIKIDQLEENVRTSNLSVFLPNYLSIRKYRFLFVSLPAILISSSLYSYTTLKDIKFDKKVPRYTKETTLYNPDNGECKTSDYVYVLNDLEDLLNCTVSEPDGLCAVSRVDVNDTYEIKINTDDTYLEASLVRKEDGELQAKSFSSVSNYIPKDNGDTEEFEEIDDNQEYVELYDRLIKTLNDSRLLTKNDRDILSSLDASQKKEVLITIIKYENPEDIDVVLSKKLFNAKIIYSVLVLAYCIYVAFGYYSRKSAYSVYNYKITNGRLIEENERRAPGNLFYESLILKEAFLAAERERILLLWDEIKKNVDLKDQGKMLTKYEKKLIKKEALEKVPNK